MGEMNCRTLVNAMERPDPQMRPNKTSETDLWGRFVRAVTPKVLPNTWGRVVKHRNHDVLKDVVGKCVKLHSKTLGGTNSAKLRVRTQSKVSVSFDIQSVGTQRQDALVHLPVLPKLQHQHDYGRTLLMRCKPQTSICLTTKRTTQFVMQNRSSYFVLPSAWYSNLQLTPNVLRNIHHTKVSPRLSAPTTALHFVQRVQIDDEIYGGPSDRIGHCSQVQKRAWHLLAQIATTLSERTKKESRALRELLVVDPFK